MLLPVLLACASPAEDTVDTSPDTGDASDSADTSGSADSSDSADTSGSADSSDSAETGDTADTSPPPAALLTITGAYADRSFSFGCTEADPPEQLFRSLSDALGNYAGTVICGLPDAPHDRFELVLPDASPGKWTDTSQPNQFLYTSDDGTLAYGTQGAVPTAWVLSITGFTWQDAHTVQLVGAASGSWTTTEGAALGWVEASFDVMLECANCP